MKSRFHSVLLAASVAVLLAVARAEESTTTIKFSDPAKPGTLKINLGRGDLQIQGADTNEITVRSGAKPATGKPRKDGLREISASSSFALVEKDNVVTLDAAGHDWGRGSGDFKLTVPRSTTIVVQNAWGGDFKCANISGDIELNSMHGEIRLEDVAGGVVVGTMNGEIRASIRELREGKPLSFTSMNGEVVLRLPESAKATVRLRTQNGSVLTDFDEAALVTKTESAPIMSRNSLTLVRGSRGIGTDVQAAIREATQISATAVRQALEAVKEGLESARLDSDEARRQLDDAKKQLAQIERERAETDRTRRDEGRQARDLARSGRNEETAPTPPVAAPAAPTAPARAAATPRAATMPIPPKIAFPTISGGKLVTGTLNGGGPEISVSPMNGDVTIRKQEQK